MPSNDFLSWLFSDAGAGWVFGFVSLFTVIIAFIGRKRPTRVVFREVLRSSLGNFRDEFKKSIQILVDGKMVKELGQIEVEIYNDGTSPITSPAITLTMPPYSKILDIAVETQEDFSVNSEIIDNKGTIKFPYLNPVREHGHFIKASVIVDGNMKNLEVTGSGVGWSVRHLPTITTDEVMARMFIFLLGGILLAGLSSLYSKLIEYLFSINMDEFNLKSFLYSLPFYLLFGWFIWWVVHPFRMSINTLTGKKRK